MEGLDELVVQWSAEGTLLVGLVAAFLLGLRHATDPDHLVAVSTLVAAGNDRAARRAARLGLAWGLGHALTVVSLGLPIALAGTDVVPGTVRGVAEILIGILIAALAVRLVLRWRAGRFHAHLHRHGDVVHRHLHPHGEGQAHDHEHPVLTSTRQAFGLGLIHGVGGSAAVGLLFVGSVGGRSEAVLALLLFAAGTALSMAVISSGLGYSIARPATRRFFRRSVPALGALSLLFGVMYAAGGVAGLA
jgi:ABC-type nickel/cobalt efflux system permease component RcnA